MSKDLIVVTPKYNTDDKDTKVYFMCNQLKAIISIEACQKRHKAKYSITCLDCKTAINHDYESRLVHDINKHISENPSVPATGFLHNSSSNKFYPK